MSLSKTDPRINTFAILGPLVNLLHQCSCSIITLHSPLLHAMLETGYLTGLKTPKRMLFFSLLAVIWVLLVEVLEKRCYNITRLGPLSVPWFYYQVTRDMLFNSEC